MPWDRKRSLGYVETIQLILGETDKTFYRLNSAEQGIYPAHKCYNANNA